MLDWLMVVSLRTRACRMRDRRAPGLGFAHPRGGPLRHRERSVTRGRSRPARPAPARYGFGAAFEARHAGGVSPRRATQRPSTAGTSVSSFGTPPAPTAAKAANNAA